MCFKTHCFWSPYDTEYPFNYSITSCRDYFIMKTIERERGGEEGEREIDRDSFIWREREQERERQMYFGCIYSAWKWYLARFTIGQDVSWSQPSYQIDKLHKSFAYKSSLENTQWNLFSFLYVLTRKRNNNESKKCNPRLLSLSVSHVFARLFCLTT